MFKSDITKQAQAIFSWKVVTPFHPEVFLNEISECSVSKKHLSLHLDLKLEFSKHINKEISKSQKGTSVIKKPNILPRNVLLTICESFVRPHLDYGGTVYCQTNSF